jgi:hypothetical protein
MNAFHPSVGARHLPWASAVHKVGKVDAGRVPYQNARDLLGASDVWQPPGPVRIDLVRGGQGNAAGALDPSQVVCPMCRNFAWDSFMTPRANAAGAVHHPACPTLTEAGQMKPGSRTTARHQVPIRTTAFGNLGTSMWDLAKSQAGAVSTSSAPASTSTGLGWGALAVIGGIGALVLFGDKWLKARGG